MSLSATTDMILVQQQFDNHHHHYIAAPAQHGVEWVWEVLGVVTGRGTVVRLVAERGAVGGQGPELGRQVQHCYEGEVPAYAIHKCLVMVPGQREPMY